MTDLGNAAGNYYATRMFWGLVAIVMTTLACGGLLTWGVSKWIDRSLPYACEGRLP